MGRQPNINEQLENIGRQLQEALEGAAEFSSENGIDVFDGEMTARGGNIVLAMTKRTEGNVGFHVRREVPDDKKGEYFKSSDYFFGDREPEVVESRFHRSHRFMPHTMPPFDTQEVRPMNRRDIPRLNNIIGAYSLYAS